MCSTSRSEVFTKTDRVRNANGIVQTPNRRALLVINSTTGVLFRVNPQNGWAKKVNLGGTSLTAGDGLLVRGRTLYIVRNSVLDHPYQPPLIDAPA